MSDFLFTTSLEQGPRLASAIRSIYAEDAPTVHQWQGQWGSLAVSETLYHGFSAFEDDETICIVIGGPVLYFRDNAFLTAPPSAIATEAIASRFLENKICWDEDLSGPFVFFHVNKRTAELTCVTDLMAFIPVYRHEQEGEVFALGTHVDALAQVVGKTEPDPVSVADFLIRGTVTYPYTFYREIYQIGAATQYSRKSPTQDEFKQYWVPRESAEPLELKQIAGQITAGIKGYVERVTAGMDNIAQFLSGGEDSRALSGFLPQRCKRDAFIFLDGMNREGQIAKMVANRYNANFNLVQRSEYHYLDILPGATKLVGCGAEYTHVHSYGLHKQYRLSDFPAVFGGYLSDTLLKGQYIKISRQRLLLLKEKRSPAPQAPMGSLAKMLRPEIADCLNQRIEAHIDRIRQYRPTSADEWLLFWPTTMRSTIPNLYGSRRLFRSYEIFMCKEVVKASALVPQQWKLNRVLFRMCAKDVLKPTKWVRHSDGRLPYFPWYISNASKILTQVWRRFKQKIHPPTKNDGPWADWDCLQHSSRWQQMEQDALPAAEPLLNSISPDTEALLKFIHSGQASQTQRINFLQLITSQKPHAQL